MPKTGKDEPRLKYPHITRGIKGYIVDNNLTKEQKDNLFQYTCDRNTAWDLTLEHCKALDKRREKMVAIALERREKLKEGKNKKEQKKIDDNKYSFFLTEEEKKEYKKCFNTQKIIKGFYRKYAKPLLPNLRDDSGQITSEQIFQSYDNYYKKVQPNIGKPKLKNSKSKRTFSQNNTRFYHKCKSPMIKLLHHKRYSVFLGNHLGYVQVKCHDERLKDEYTVVTRITITWDNTTKKFWVAFTCHLPKEIIPQKKISSPIGIDRNTLLNGFFSDGKYTRFEVKKHEKKLKQLQRILSHKLECLKARKKQITDALTAYNAKKEYTKIYKIPEIYKSIRPLGKNRKALKTVLRLLRPYHNRRLNNTDKAEIKDILIKEKNIKKASHEVALQYRKIFNVRHTFLHTISKYIAETSNFVVFEDLKLKNLLRSASGTKENPGKNVAQKRGSNRELQNQSLGKLRQLIEYKVLERGGQVVGVPSKNTSRECPKCHYISHRNINGRAFKCKSCNFTTHRDYVGAINTLSRCKEMLKEIVDLCDYVDLERKEFNKIQKYESLKKKKLLLPPQIANDKKIAGSKQLKPEEINYYQSLPSKKDKESETSEDTFISFDDKPIGNILQEHDKKNANVIEK